MGIFARHNGEWYRVDGEHGGPVGDSGELPGIGGWANITDVKGKGNKYSYGDWVAFEWTADGEVTTTEGLLDMLIVGGGGGIAQPSGTVRHGCGGKVEYGLNPTTAGPHNVVVGGLFSDIGLGSEVQGVCTVGASPSAQNESVALGAGAVVDPGGDLTPRWYGIKSSITGNEIEYARGNETNQPNTGHGSNGDGSGGSSGVVIVRVPKANYTGDMLDGAFDIPTTRQAVVEALEEKVEEVKDTMIIDGRETKIKRNRKR